MPQDNPKASLPAVRNKLDPELDPKIGVPPPPPASAQAAGPSLGAECIALLRYLCQTEVHTYAFSVAANAILSLFPFIVLMLSLSRNVFHSPKMQVVVGDMFRYVLPVGQDYVVRTMTTVARAHRGVQFFSLFMLVVSSTGIFLPLEVALNQVWQVGKNRSYLHNQVVSLLLAFAAGLLALGSVGVTATQSAAFDRWTSNHPRLAFMSSPYWLLVPLAALMSVSTFFLIYWLLPNRKIPIRAVLPTAIVTGLAWEGMKLLYIAALPLLNLQAVYGPFALAVSLMMWAFLTGLLLLAGAHFSANRYTLRQVRTAEMEKMVQGI